MLGDNTDLEEPLVVLQSEMSEVPAGGLTVPPAPGVQSSGRHSLSLTTTTNLNILISKLSNLLLAVYQSGTLQLRDSDVDAQKESIALMP